MKYRDLITIFMVIIFILSFAYVIAVDSSIWFISIILFFLLIFITFKLWIEK